MESYTRKMCIQIVLMICGSWAGSIHISRQKQIEDDCPTTQSYKTEHTSVNILFWYII